MSGSPNRAKAVNNGGNPAAGDSEPTPFARQSSDVIDLTSEEEHSSLNNARKQEQICGARDQGDAVPNPHQCSDESAGMHRTTPTENHIGNKEKRANKTKPALTQPEASAQSLIASATSTSQLRCDSTARPSASTFVHKDVMMYHQSCQANAGLDGTSSKRHANQNGSNKESPISTKQFISDIIKETVHQTQLYHCHHSHCMRSIQAHPTQAMPAHDVTYAFQNQRAIAPNPMKPMPQIMAPERMAGVHQTERSLMCQQDRRNNGAATPRHDTVYVCHPSGQFVVFNQPKPQSQKAAPPKKRSYTNEQQPETVTLMNYPQQGFPNHAQPPSLGSNPRFCSIQAASSAGMASNSTPPPNKKPTQSQPITYKFHNVLPMSHMPSTDDQAHQRQNRTVTNHSGANALPVKQKLKQTYTTIKYTWHGTAATEAEKADAYSSNIPLDFSKKKVSGSPGNQKRSSEARARPKASTSTSTSAKDNSSQQSDVSRSHLKVTARKKTSITIAPKPAATVTTDVVGNSEQGAEITTTSAPANNGIERNDSSTNNVYFDTVTLMNPCRFYRCQSIANPNAVLGLIRVCIKCRGNYTLACGNIASGISTVDLATIECPKCLNLMACYCGQAFSDKYIGGREV